MKTYTLPLLGALGACCLASGQLIAGSTLLPTSADAHVDGLNPDLNFGSAEVLVISQTDLGGHKAYLRFDASGMDPISRIGGMQITSSSDLTRTYSAYVITGEGVNDWTESGITWLNAPANNVTGTDRNFVPGAGQTVTLLGTISGGGVGTVLTIPIAPTSVGETQLLNALNTGTRKVTIGIRYNSSQVTTVGLYSREHEGGSMAAALEILPPERVIAVSMDAHVNYNFPDVNFGTFETLNLSQNGDPGAQKAYLLFDASSLGATQVERVEKLRFYYSGSVNITRTIMFRLLSGAGVNDWDEMAINWLNAPANNTATREFVPYEGQSVTLLGSTQYAAGAAREMNFVLPEGSDAETTLLTALNTGDRKATIGASYSSSQVSTIGIYSREYSEGIYTATLWFGQKTPVPPTIHWVGFTGGKPVLELGGPADANYTVLSSTNLTDWVEEEIIPVTLPPVQWTDASAETGPRKFYRVLVP